MLNKKIIFVILILLIISSYNIQSLENTDIIKYILENDYHSLKTLLETGTDIEQTDKFGNTPLFISILEPDKIDITKLLIHYGADVNAVDNFGQTTLIKAIYSNNIKAVELLLENGADIDQTNFQNRTPLIINISTNNNYEITKLLLNYGANINAQDIHNFTSLYYAVLNEDINLIKYLLEKDAKIFNSKSPFNSAYFAALSRNNPDIIKLLINHIYKNEILIKNLSRYITTLYPHINIGIPINFDLKETIISNRILILNVFLFLLISLLFFKNKKIIIFSPFIFILLLQLKYGHNMITWEEWENFNIYNVFKSHDYLTFFKLILSNHISHNILIPRIIITFISSIFGFYPLILMITATIFHFLSVILIFKKNEFEKMPALYLFVISMFFFSLRQIENFFWGFQIAFLFCNLSSISCFYFTDNYLKSNKTADLIKASILAIVASFSSLMGILCFIPLLYSQFKTRTRTIYLNVLIFCLIFFQNFEFLLKSSKSNFSIKEIFYIINSFFTYFGSAFSHNIWFAYTTFLIFLISLLIVIKNKKILDCFFNWCLLFYSIGTGILIAFGRGFWGFDSALISRYSTFSITGLLAVFFLLKKIERLKILRYILLFSMLLSSVFYSFYGSISAKNIYNTKEFYWGLLFDENYGLQKIDYNIYFWDKNIIESNLPYITIRKSSY